jgi:DNA-binding protein H-NS
MTKTYAQVLKQIDALSKEAERLKRKEIDGVIARIKEAIDAYGLTAADLGLATRRGPKPGFKRATKASGKKKAVKGAKAVVRFRDDAGNTWIGRGPRPQWIQDALAAGKKLGDFAV